ATGEFLFVELVEIVLRHAYQRGNGANDDHVGGAGVPRLFGELVHLDAEGIGNVGQLEGLSVVDDDAALGDFAVVIFVGGMVVTSVVKKTVDISKNPRLPEEAGQGMEIQEMLGKEPQKTNINIPKESPKGEEKKKEEPAEVQKTRLGILNLKKLIEGDPRRAIFLCSGDPCRIPTQRFESAEDGSHLDCGGGTMAPAPDTKVGISIKADNVIIENCVFDGFDTAIEIEGSNSVITKNTIKNSAGNGILVKGQKSAIFENTIEGNKGAGIFVAGESNEHAIAENVLQNNGMQGLHVLGAGALTIIDNTITGNKSEGIWLSGQARENLLFGNTIEGNGGECGIYFSAIETKSPINNKILENKTDKQKISCS
ncbi:MAG: right-handed parallel beta-helix repeat-containing protein, partial [Nanoarchaeota archaeon]|nr:right-handed parallel beta-helix repeat-containing protein [Nanoarchaeota archaeon]